MMTADTNWNLWRTFGAVLETGSLSGAARLLGLAQPTIGRQIEALEARLGYPLFLRSSQGLMATEAARGLHPLAKTLASTAGALDRLAGNLLANEAGTVRITASDVVSVEILPPLLASFCADHPAISVELSASNAVQDLLSREADIAVRMTAPVQQALVGRRIGALNIHLYAHRSYVERRGMPQTVEDLRQHTLVGYDALLDIYGWLAHLGIDVGRADFSIRTDNEPTQLALVRSGAGIGGVQDRLAARDPDLLPILPGQIVLPMEFWVVTHEDLRHLRPVRLMFDHLVTHLKLFLEQS